MPHELSVIYEKLMGIAARTGDTLAIRSINPLTDMDEDHGVDIEGDFLTLFWILSLRCCTVTWFPNSGFGERLKYVVLPYEPRKQQYDEDVTLCPVDTDKTNYFSKRLSHFVEQNRFNFILGLRMKY